MRFKVKRYDIWQHTEFICIIKKRYFIKLLFKLKNLGAQTNCAFVRARVVKKSKMQNMRKQSAAHELHPKYLIQ